MEPAVLNLLCGPVERRLVDARAVGKAGLEEVVVAARDLLYGVGEAQALLGRQVDESARMPLGDDHRLKGPDGPPGAHHEERLVLVDDALGLLRLQLHVVREEVAPPVLGPVLGQLDGLGRGLLGQRARRPDLAVRVRVRAAHGRALVLEDLHVAELLRRRRGQAFGRGGSHQGERLLRDGGERVRGRQVRGVDPRPCRDDRQDLRGGHVG